MMETITRKEALEQGLPRYFTGKPCKHGHVCERIVRNWGCVECNKISHRKNDAKYKGTQKRKEWNKNYRTKHPERHKLSRRRAEEKARTNLSNPYIYKILTKRFCLTADDIPPLLVEAKRAHLKLTRQLKEIENGNTST